MATQITNKGHLEILVSWLKEQLPLSIIVFSVLRNMLEGRFRYYKIYVDKWPDRKCLAVVPDKTYYGNKFWSKRVFLFGEDMQILQKLVHSPGVIDWTSELEFYGITQSVWTSLESTFKSSKDTFQQDPDDTYMYYIGPESITPNVSKPDGFEIGPMTEAVMKQVISNWKFYEDGFEEYFKELIKSEAFTICLYDEKRKAVGWIVQHFSGDIGMLYVVPEYRRKGCGRYLLSSLLKMVINRDGYACSFIETYNSISLKLHESVGMTKLENERYFWQRFRYKVNF